MAAADNTPQTPPDIDPEQFASMVAGATDDQLREGLRSNWDMIVPEIFKRMGEHYEPSRAAGTEAVVEWRLTGHPEREHDRWQLAIRGDGCAVARDGEDTATVTYTIDGVEFIRLVSGQAKGPELFMTGKLKVEGDLMLAARMQSFFRIPGSP